MGEDFDINSAIDTVAESMNIGKEESDEPILDDKAENQDIDDDASEDDAIETEITDDAEEGDDEPEEAQVVVKDPPKSWAKDQMCIRDRRYIRCMKIRQPS